MGCTFSSVLLSHTSSTTASTPSAGEPSWHRQLRRNRTKARHRLRSFLDGADVPLGQVNLAIRRLERHHSASTLPQRTRIALATMAHNQPWWCYACGKWCKASMQFCGFCGQRWDQGPQAAAYRPRTETSYPWAPKSPRRKSPRQRPVQPGTQQQAKGAGRGKGKPGKAGAPQPQPSVETYTVATWQPEGIPPAPEQKPAFAEDPQMQELWGALRGAMSQQTLPPAVAEAIAKVEGLQGKQVTKSMHAQTKAMGSAKKQLHEIQDARRRQDNSWVEFLNQTLQALEKGSQKYDEAIQKFDDQEKDARQKLVAARAAIKELAGQMEKEAPASEEDEISDIELMDTTQSSGTSVPEESKVVQANKRLRVTLDALLTKLPAAEDTTPRRRRSQQSSSVPLVPSAKDEAKKESAAPAPRASPTPPG